MLSKVITMSDTIYRIVVNDFPDTVNHMYINNYNGSKRLSERSKKFVTSFHLSFVKQHPQGVDIENLSHVDALIVLCSSWRTKKGEPKRSDIDNRVKNVLDAFSKATGIDDSFIFSLDIRKFDVKDPKDERVDFQFKLYKKQLEEKE